MSTFFEDFTRDFKPSTDTYRGDGGMCMSRREGWLCSLRIDYHGPYHIAEGHTSMGAIWHVSTDYPIGG